MFLSLIFFISFFSYSQPDRSTSTYITHSLYDLNYIDDTLTVFSSSGCEISRSSETLSLLVSLKKLGYTRSDIYSVILCACEKEMRLEELKFLTSNKEPFKIFREFLEKNGCDYFLFKKRAFSYLSEKRDFYLKNDLELLNKIIDKYFK